MVPQEWISPPDHETADGELLDDYDTNNEDDDGNEDENAAMLGSDQKRRRREEAKLRRSSRNKDTVRENRVAPRDETPPPRIVTIKDNSGRQLPASERAPLPKR